MKKTSKKQENVTGNYSTAVYNNNELISFDIDWDRLKIHVREAIAEYEHKRLVEEAPYHPGYEGAVIIKEKKPVKRVAKAKPATKSATKTKKSKE
jgi:hypothetical protein